MFAVRVEIKGICQSTNLHKKNLKNIEEIMQFIPSKFKANKNETGESSALCEMDTTYKVNGNIINKYVTFYLNGLWALTVASTEIDLGSLLIDNHFTCDSDSISVVLEIAMRVTFVKGLLLPNLYPVTDITH